jgi:hypothetical protein
MMKSLGECIEGDVHLDMLVTQGHHRCDDDDNMAAFERLTLRPSGVFQSSTQSEELSRPVWESPSTARRASLPTSRRTSLV